MKYILSACPIHRGCTIQVVFGKESDGRIPFLDSALKQIAERDFPRKTPASRLHRRRASSDAPSRCWMTNTPRCSSCVSPQSRTIYAFYASDVGGPIRIALATSIRRPVVGSPGHGPRYAGIPIGDEELGYRICSARFPGPFST